MISDASDYVFISYSSHQRDYALRFRDFLLGQGFNVWIDKDQIETGERFTEAIVQAIRGCQAVVLILTPDSYTSRWCKREIVLADEKGKLIFPLWREGNADDLDWLELAKILHPFECYPIPLPAPSLLETAVDCCIKFSGVQGYIQLIAQLFVPYLRSAHVWKFGPFRR